MNHLTPINDAEEQRLNTTSRAVIDLLPAQERSRDHCHLYSSAVMEAAPSFPLYLLPTKVIIRFLRILNFQEIIAIASLSEKSKALCKTSNHKARIQGVSISRFINILVAQGLNLIYFLFYYEPEDTQLAAPIKIYVKSLFGAEIECRSLEINLIFEFLEPRSFRSLLFQQGCEQFDLGVVKQKFKPFERLSISADVHVEYSKRILAEMVKDAKSLLCPGNPFQIPEDFQKFLVQNLQEIEWNFTLDDLLICNSSLIRTNLSEKKMNRFLKLWTNGANRNLKTMIITAGRASNAHEVLRGLSNRELADGQRRTVERAYPEYNRLSFAGFDIYRVDGTKGTILFDARGMVFYVWE
ncbi:hypothetical protein CAEBREN_01845 [Caenorhabditis brenneri]|uniref:F-box domain-containing protein n=1 Tax=Caenorhabditis brenneri TaxID=135651 RepID=G0MC61_CAEBE|nr:hypothetical protein CAEBREN_01845 [Caenorhabditis brenneri]